MDIRKLELVSQYRTQWGDKRLSFLHIFMSQIPCFPLHFAIFLSLLHCFSLFIFAFHSSLSISFISSFVLQNFVSDYYSSYKPISAVNGGNCRPSKFFKLNFFRNSLLSFPSIICLNSVGLQISEILQSFYRFMH